MQFVHTGHSEDVLISLHQQQISSNNCDVTITTSSNDDVIVPVQCTRDNTPVPAHRCVLVASSEYFQTLFRCRLGDTSTVVLRVPGLSNVTLRLVIEHMYTGSVIITADTVENIIRLADYLCVPKLLEFCSEYLVKHLNDETCLKTKFWSDTYSLSKTLSDAVTSYIRPRMASLILHPDITELPAKVLQDLLVDPETNYMREEDILNSICSWILRHQVQADDNGRVELYTMLEHVEFSYLTKRTLTDQVLSNERILQWMTSQKSDLLKTLQDFVLTETRKSRDVLDVILCRSRAAKIGDEVQVAVYVIVEDEWCVLKEPTGHQGLLAGLESMVLHQQSLFFISSTIEDMYGYMHHAPETKHFYSLTLNTGVWEQLAAPSDVQGQCRLVTVINRLFIIDRFGVIEEYIASERRWTTSCKTGFPALPKTTLYIVPMSAGFHIYVLRAYSTGYSFCFAQKSFALYMFNTTRNTWNMLSEIESTDLFVSGENVNFSGYSVSPGLVSLHDELGRLRARFDLTSKEWSTFDTKVVRPDFIRDIYGSVEYSDRVYFVAKSALDNMIFAMCDNTRCRFKLTRPPPFCLSGLVCHLTLSRSLVHQLTLLPT